MPTNPTARALEKTQAALSDHIDQIADTLTAAINAGDQAAVQAIADDLNAAAARMAAAITANTLTATPSAVEPPPAPAAQQVATWAELARVATAKRDEAIRQMRAEGATLRAIANAAGITHAGVARVLARS